MNHEADKNRAEVLKAIIRFLQRTADGEYTEVPPWVVVPSRVPDLRERVHEEDYLCTYTN